MIDKKNSEGYMDLTMHHAPTKIEKEEKAAHRAARFRPLVYVCSPFSGDIDGNTEKARRCSRFAVDKGAIPLTVHLLFPQFVSEETERPLALYMGSIVLAKCQEVWVFGSHISEGMAAEIVRAKKLKKTIRYFTESMEEVMHNGTDIG